MVALMDDINMQIYLSFTKKFSQKKNSEKIVLIMGDLFISVNKKYLMTSENPE